MSQRTAFGYKRGDEKLLPLSRERDPSKAAERLLKIRPRSVGELRYRLKIKGFGQEAIDRTIDRLLKAGALNDASFASWWIAQRTLLKPTGALKLIRELREKRIDQSIIDQAVASSGVKESELELAKEALKGRLSYYGRLNTASRRRRVAGFLARRGFANEVISEIIRSL